MFTAQEKVIYASSIPATVISILKNGVLIGFWGRGLQKDKWVLRRVSKTYLEKL